VVAAKRLYEQYLDVTDKISGDGGDGIGRLRPLVSPAEFRVERDGFLRLKQKGIRVAGESVLVKFVLQSADLSTGSVSAYACVDLKKARVLNNAGEDVTPAGRVDRQTSIARFRWSGGKLVLNEDGSWSGESIC
jgi:hypothetical protein